MQVFNHLDSPNIVGGQPIAASVEDCLQGMETNLAFIPCQGSDISIMCVAHVRV